MHIDKSRLVIKKKLLALLNYSVAKKIKHIL